MKNILLFLLLTSTIVYGQGTLPWTNLLKSTGATGTDSTYIRQGGVFKRSAFPSGTGIYVKKAGTDTITGVKTFVPQTIFQGGLRFQNPTYGTNSDLSVIGGYPFSIIGDYQRSKFTSQGVGVFYDASEVDSTVNEAWQLFGSGATIKLRYPIGNKSYLFPSDGGQVTLASREWTLTHLAGKTIAIPTSAQTGQSIRWNNSTLNWEYYTPSAGSTGTVTSVTAGLGMNFSAITTSGSIVLDQTKVPYFSGGISGTPSNTTFINGAGAWANPLPQVSSKKLLGNYTNATATANEISIDSTFRLNSAGVLSANTGNRYYAGTSLTLINSDHGSVIYFTASTLVTVTLPSGLKSNFQCALVKANTGNVFCTFSAPITSIDALNNNDTIAQLNAMASVYYKTATTWGMYGVTGSAITSNPSIASIITADVSKSASFTVATTDIGKMFQITTGSTNVVATFPAASSVSDGFYFYLRKADAGIGLVTSPSLTSSLPISGHTMLVWSDGTNWFQRHWHGSYDVNGSYTISAASNQNINFGLSGTGQLKINNLSSPGVITNDATGLLSSSTGTGFIKSTAGGAISYDPTTYIPTAGGTLTGALTLAADATTSLNPVSYQQFNSAISSIPNKPITYSRTKNATILNATYNNGSSGVGATLIANVNGFLSPFLTVAPNINYKVLVNTFTGVSSAYNGVYVVTNLGSSSTPWILTRDVSMNTNTGINGAVVAVYYGNNSLPEIYTLIAINTAIIGTTALNFKEIAYLKTDGSNVMTGSLFNSSSLFSIGLNDNITLMQISPDDVMPYDPTINTPLYYGVASTTSKSILNVGNSTYGGILGLYNASSNAVKLQSSNTTANYTITLPATAPATNAVLQYNGTNYIWGAVSGGSGTVTGVSSANADIAVATGTTTPILTLNSGTGANQIAKRDGSGNFNATTVTTNANLNGDVSSVGNTTSYNNIVPIAKGGTGTATPSLVAGANVIITGTFPNQAISSTAGGSGTVTSVTSANTSASVATTTTTPVITINDAPKLTNARAINGVNFDGTAPITVTAAAGTLTGTTLNSTVVSSSLTSHGTLTTGVWNATAIVDAYIASAATWNAKQNAISLTTTGTNGTATFVSNTLNVPAYTLAGLGGISGSGTSGQIGYFNGTSSLTSGSNFTFDGNAMTVGLSGNIIPNASQVVRFVKSSSGSDVEINGNGYARIYFNDYSKGTDSKYYEMINLNSEFLISRLNDINTVRSTYFKIGTTGGITMSNLSTAGIVTNTSAGLLGTVASIGVTQGGNGLTTATTGGIRYASATNTLSELPIGATNNYLKVVAGLPAWGDFTTDVNALVGATYIPLAGSNAITGNFLSTGSGMAVGLFSNTSIQQFTANNYSLTVRSPDLNSYAGIAVSGINGASGAQFGVTYATTPSRQRFLSVTENSAYSFHNDNVNIITAGKTYGIKTGTNGMTGSATLVAGTVTISNTNISSTSTIYIVRTASSGTPGDLEEAKASRVNGTSFTIQSRTLGVASTLSTLDASTFDYIIFNQLP